MEGNAEATLVNEINRIKNKIDSMAMEKAEASIFRSKARWIREGEKNSKYFLSLEKKRYLTKNMTQLIVKGELINDQSKLLEAQRNFYESLYTTDKSVHCQFDRDDKDLQISDENKNLCDSDMSISELYDATMTLKSNKTPGLDGLSVEFYRTFWRQLGDKLHRMVNNSFDRSILPESLRRGLITLLPKTGKDLRYIKNYRPLTLLNTDYKILAKALDNRLSTALPTIIRQDQTGFVKGRCIAYNVRKSLDIMQHCSVNNIPAVILSCDMEKCFDKIEHRAIYRALELFNFGPKFIKWVSLFFTSFQVCTQNFGLTSDFFPKTRGVNQGCPISPSLFLCTSEILANSLRNHTDIHGIKIGEIEYLISQFADDTDLYLPYDEKIINSVLTVLHDIRLVTGLTISYDKTVLYRIGSIANINAQCYTKYALSWTNEPIRTLGVDLHPFGDMEKNLEGIINKIKTISEMWYHRHLTLYGKIVLINTLMSSLFIYKLQNLSEISECTYREYKDVVERFLWNGMKPKINIETLYCKNSCGVLNLTNIKLRHCALLCKWMVECINNDAVANLANNALQSKVSIQVLYHANIAWPDCMKLCKSKKGFWFEVLRIWCNISFRPANATLDSNDILNEMISLNSNIKAANSLWLPNKNWPTYVKENTK